jgi:hypothetical protein
VVAAFTVTLHFSQEQTGGTGETGGTNFGARLNSSFEHGNAYKLPFLSFLLFDLGEGYSAKVNIVRTWQRNAH